MKLLFLGLLYNPAQEDELLARSKVGLSNATNSYQWNLIEGLDELLPEPPSIYSALPVGAFPKYFKNLILPRKEWSHKEDAKDLEVGCINLPILKQLTRYFLMKYHVNRWCTEHKNAGSVIIAYSMYLPYLKLLHKLKKKYPKLITCIIVPDLPNPFGFEKLTHSPKNMVLRYLEKLQYRYTGSADSYVLLTEAMTKPLNIKHKPYVVLEAICPIQSVIRERQFCSTSKILMYSGALYQRYGLNQLIRAFQGITGQDYELWICGTGDYQEEIQKAAKIDKRIKYFGYLPKEMIHNLQQRATVIINPRPGEEAYTKYSFPSKTMEAMSLGKPVLCFPLEGIPKEYDNYLYYIKENSVEEIRASILTITSKSREELEAFGERARLFVTKNKNAKLQAGKILSMLTDKSFQVLQINITCQYGSTGRLVEVLHYGMLKQGIKSKIAYAAYSSRIPDAFRIESTLEHYCRRGLNHFFGHKYIHSAPGTLRLMKNIKKLKPDLIHLHNIQQNSIHYPMLLEFLKKYGVPVVYTLHDCWAFTGGCYHFTQWNCKDYQRGCQDCILPKKDRDICNITPKDICQQKKIALHGLSCLRIVCVSQWLKECAEKSILKDLPLQVIYNGIDTDIFTPTESEIRKELQLAKEDFVILGVANHWTEQKGLMTFLALSKLLKSCWHIVLVGLSPKDCPTGVIASPGAEYLKDYPNSIIAIPRTEDLKELAKIYSCADVYLNASKEETFGLTTAEAMACGIPVIAYDFTACGEILTPDTGILLKVGSSMEDTHKDDSLKEDQPGDDNLKELFSALEEVERRGRGAYRSQCSEYIKRNYSRERMIEGYLELYHELINPGGK